jgi:O-antigen ligase
MVFNILPREMGLFLTGLLIFYFIFSPLADSLWVFIASIPLFVALPITESFDSMANWRILLAVLFLVWFFRTIILRELVRETEGSRGLIASFSRFFASLRMTFGRWKLKENLKHYLMEYLVGIFLLIGCLSLLVADDVWAGVKKLLFIINIFLLFIIIRNLAAKNKEIIFRIVGAIKVAIGLTLGIGFLQLIMAFFVNLHQFWHFWDRNVINVFYGQNLSNLLSYSNTWFSYYSYQLPTLRMFSIFPDSHSFAFFCILALPFFLVAIFLNSREKKGKTTLFYFLLILCLLAIIFSGSRGAWLNALSSLVVFLFLILLFYSPTIRSWTDFFIPRFYKSWKKQIQLIVGSLIIFFLLFPIASAILFLPQYIQLGSEAVSGISLFERARSIIDFFEISAKSRLEIWQRTGDSIITHPFLGIGLGNFPLIIKEEISAAKRGASAHNLYLDFASEMGIFALLILLAIFWYILKEAWQIFTRHKKLFFRAWAGFFLLALIWILGYSLFDVVLLNDKVFLFFIANLGLLYAAKLSLPASPA